jgi:hypothetical protein
VEIASESDTSLGRQLGSSDLSFAQQRVEVPVRGDHRRSRKSSFKRDLICKRDSLCHLEEKGMSANLDTVVSRKDMKSK